MANYAQTLMDPMAATPETPNAAKSAREWAALLTRNSMQPVNHWAQGLGNVFQAALGGYTDYKANEGERLGQQRSIDDLLKALNPTNTTSPATQSPQRFQFSAPPAGQFADIPGITEAQTAQNPSTRGFNNNNPGNIEDGPFARAQAGYLGSDGRFAKFASLDAGNAAMDALLKSYGNRGFNTPESIINRWAPPSDNNPTNAYAANVAKALGVQQNAALDMNNPEIRQQIMRAITLQENGAAQPQQNNQATPPIPTAQQMLAPSGAPSAALPASAGVTPQGVTPQLDRQALAAILRNPWASDGMKQFALTQLAPKEPQVIKLGEGDTAFAFDPRSRQLQQIASGQQKDVKPIEINTGTAIELRHPKTNALIERIPIDVAGKKKQEIAGESQAKAEANLPKAEASAAAALDLIAQIRAHPGMHGAIGWQGDLPTFPGSKQRDFEVLLNQAKGQTFLQAIETLKGSGQITEIEGQKAQQAIARLERAQSPAAFKRALDDFEKTIRDALKVQRTTAGQQQAPAPSNIRTWNPATGLLE